MELEGNIMTEVVWAIGAYIQDKEGNILISRRKPGSLFEGLWEFPSGKIEKGETPEEALKRELFEEIGIEVEKEDMSCFRFCSYENEGKHIVFLLYRIEKYKGIPFSKEEQEIKWVNSLSEILNHGIPYNSKLFRL